ncbi:hypothetical protein NA56DRAFT_647318 [Hyaloscypha hepaticicola]|uniref:Uncharacterized protein n=1 Tax=Hyaloscypha hepaticicola TaxID=2082293 RepID=A0A2J6PZ50_9HELO|nr:hypothetical protein NA56DRAFT_647318 [Hyaloscypha hepaticicola]
MPFNTGSYVLSSEDTTSPFNNGQAQTASTRTQPSYEYNQQQQQQSERMQPQYTSTQSPYNQYTGGPMPQFPSSEQKQQRNDYPPSYEPSPTPYQYPNPNIQTGAGGSPISYQHQPIPHPGPIAQQGGKPLFTPETKEKGKEFCAECGSSAKWACGATMLIFGCLCGFCGALFS